MSKDDILQIFLLNPVAAEFLTAAIFAVRAHPKRVELFNGGLHKRGVVGENPRLKVATQAALHADARTRQVRGADVGGFQIKKQPGRRR